VIVDLAAGKPLTDGEVGEIWASGPSIADGYWRRPEETAAAFGQVIEGRAVVDRIARVPVGGHEGTTPTRAVWLEALTISIT